MRPNVQVQAQCQRHGEHRQVSARSFTAREDRPQPLRQRCADARNWPVEHQTASAFIN